MTVLRINKKEKNFLILDKSCLQQITLSWQAKGLHAYLMGLHDNCQIKVAKLVEKATNKRDSVRNILNELKRAGYITTEKLRDSVSGKFGMLEYVVHELPVLLPENLDGIRDSDPETENPSLAPKHGNPETENPETGNPSPEKASVYIRINNNKDQKKQILTAASVMESQDDITMHQSKKAAAASFSQIQNNEHSVKSQGNGNLVKLNGNDLLIGETLTAQQMIRVQSMISKLHLVDMDIEQLEQEVTYCLLNNQYFRACAQDFGRKLNSIRLVISRGEWQTPVGMIIEQQQGVIEQQKELVNHTRMLQQQILDAQAEYNHFQRFLNVSHGPGREMLEETLIKTQKKIEELESKLALDTYQQFQIQ